MDECFIGASIHCGNKSDCLPRHFDCISQQRFVSKLLAVGSRKANNKINVVVRFHVQDSACSNSCLTKRETRMV